MSLRETIPTEVQPASREEAVQIAEEVGLRYVSDLDAGFTRKRRGKGFFYLDENNQKITSEPVLTRIRSLVIPPAWSSVWICRHANGHIQATGRDARMRKQYRYHPRWCEVRNETKFAKLSAFAKSLPGLRARLEEDLKLPGMARNKVLAAVVRVMEETMIRIGNCEYAEENDSYGLTTIRNHHAKVDGHEVKFRFKGKSGILHECGFRDKRLSHIISKCQDLPGQELFAYIDDEGTVRDVGSSDVNEYLRSISGEAITAKDFRTWGATVHAAEVLFATGPAKSETKRERKARDLKACVAASEYLRNTKTVCRKYYIHPAVLKADESGFLFAAFRKAKRKQKAAAAQHLELSELAVIEILNQA